MESSGANSKLINFIAPDGTTAQTNMISTRNVVEIGCCTFKRSDLLLAMGVSVEEVRKLESLYVPQDQVGDLQGNGQEPEVQPMES